jgi:hypothetical protein
VGYDFPIFIVSILLIPDWNRENNSYQDHLYVAKKNLFVNEVRNTLSGIEGMVVEDFYTDCVMLSEERAYMHNLKAIGINADMIKTVAIINNAEYCRHLQIDSNTIVPSFKELYLRTFHAAEQKDGINASYYDDFYVSAHNKMVYTTPSGFIAKESQLKVFFWEWCKDHKDDDNVNGDKQADKNSIYSKVFTQALYQIEYVKKFTLINNKTVYPATLDGKVYWLTNCMVTAVNMSWSSNQLGINNQLIQIPAVRIGADGIFNYQCLFNVIKKYTGNLRVHSKALGLVDLSGTGDLSRDLLLHVSNCDLEIRASREFIKNAIQRSPRISVSVSPNTSI